MSEAELQQGQFQQEEQNQDSNSSEFIKTTKAGRKSLCDVCVKSLSKYTCPGCEVKSCSLACVNKHKISKQCNGKANPTEYLQKSKISQDTVRKDFQFVKNMLEETDKVKKTLTGVTTPTQQPKRFYFLRKQARSEYNIKVHQGPAMIERHRENISFYFMKTKTIYWVIEVLYFKGNKKYSRYLKQQPQPDTKTIQEIMPTDFLCQELLLKDINTQRTQDFDVFVENREIVNPYEEKQSNEKSSGSQKVNKVIQVAKDTQLCEALRNLNVYEFPTLILVHKSLRKTFLKWKKAN